MRFRIYGEKNVLNPLAHVYSGRLNNRRGRANYPQEGISTDTKIGEILRKHKQKINKIKGNDNHRRGLRPRPTGAWSAPVVMVAVSFDFIYFYCFIVLIFFIFYNFNVFAQFLNNYIQIQIIQVPAAGAVDREFCVYRGVALLESLGCLGNPFGSLGTPWGSIWSALGPRGSMWESHQVPGPIWGPREC